jgi:hypothetical protein
MSIPEDIHDLVVRQIHISHKIGCPGSLTTLKPCWILPSHIKQNADLEICKLLFAIVCGVVILYDAAIFCRVTCKGVQFYAHIHIHTWVQ